MASRPAKKGEKRDILAEEYARPDSPAIRRTATPKVDRREVSDQAAIARAAEEARIAAIKAETRDDLLLMFKAAERNENVRLSAIRGKQSKRPRTWADRIEQEGEQS